MKQVSQLWSKCEKPWFLHILPIFWPFLAEFHENQTFSDHLTLKWMKQNIIVIIKSHFKPFQVERIEQKQFIWKNFKNSENFSEVKSLGHLQGILTENFFFAFLCSKWLNFENWAKKIFSKKKFFRKKKFSGPRKNGRFRPYLGQIFFFWHAVFCKSSEMIPSFVLSHFQTKLMQNFSSKSQKPQKNSFLATFWPKSGRNIFFSKIGLCQ